MSGKGVEGSLSGGRALSVIGRRRRALAGGVAAAILFAGVGSAHADWDRWERPGRWDHGDRWDRWDRGDRWESREPVAKRAVQAKKAPKVSKAPKAAKALQMPLIAISIASQRLTLYDRGEVIAQSPVSTGMPGHPTPTGVFSVIQKQVFHESNIYSGAPMPYMQRITWSGVAMHAGVLPGHPASHGCIRMPYDFAVKLYGLTRAGARVIITRNEITPVAFEHPGLFQLPKPAVDSLSQLTAPPGPEKPGAAVKTAQRQSPTMMSDAGDPRTPAGVFKPRVEANAAGPHQDAEPPVATTADAAKEPVQEKPQENAPESAQQATQGSAQGPARAAAPRDAAGNAVAPVDNASAELREPADLAAAADAPAVPDDAAQDHAQEDAQEGVQASVKDSVNDAVQIGARPAAETAAPAPTPETGAPAFEPATGTVMVKPVVVTPAQPIEMPKTFEQASAPAKSEGAPRAAARPDHGLCQQEGRQGLRPQGLPAGVQRARHGRAARASARHPPLHGQRGAARWRELPLARAFAVGRIRQADRGAPRPERQPEPARPEDRRVRGPADRERRRGARSGRDSGPRTRAHLRLDVAGRHLDHLGSGARARDRQ